MTSEWCIINQMKFSSLIQTNFFPRFNFEMFFIWIGTVVFHVPVVPDVLIAVGFASSVIAFLGCCGAFMKNPCMLFSVHWVLLECDWIPVFLLKSQLCLHFLAFAVFNCNNRITCGSTWIRFVRIDKLRSIDRDRPYRDSLRCKGAKRATESVGNSAAWGLFSSIENL